MALSVVRSGKLDALHGAKIPVQNEIAKVNEFTVYANKDTNLTNSNSAGFEYLLKTPAGAVPKISSKMLVSILAKTSAGAQVADYVAATASTHVSYKVACALNCFSAIRIEDEQGNLIMDSSEEYATRVISYIKMLQEDPDIIAKQSALSGIYNDGGEAGLATTGYNASYEKLNAKARNAGTGTYGNAFYVDLKYLCSFFEIDQVLPFPWVVKLKRSTDANFVTTEGTTSIVATITRVALIGKSVANLPNPRAQISLPLTKYSVRPVAIAATTTSISESVKVPGRPSRVFLLHHTDTSLSSSGTWGDARCMNMSKCRLTLTDTSKGEVMYVPATTYSPTPSGNVYLQSDLEAQRMLNDTLEALHNPKFKIHSWFGTTSDEETAAAVHNTILAFNTARDGWIADGVHRLENGSVDVTVEAEYSTPPAAGKLFIVCEYPSAVIFDGMGKTVVTI